MPRYDSENREKRKGDKAETHSGSFPTPSLNLSCKHSETIDVKCANSTLQKVSRNRNRALLALKHKTKEFVETESQPMNPVKIISNFSMKREDNQW